MTTSDPLSILVVNPGGTSTKVAYFQDAHCVFSQDIRHAPSDFSGVDSVYGQLAARIATVRRTLGEHGIDKKQLNAVVGRGGPLVPVPSGTYLVDRPMLDAIEQGRVMVEHPSLLGAPIAHAFASEAGCPAYIVDPVTVDELLDEARLTGIPEIPRRALSHALNVKSASRYAAAELKRSFEEINLIVLHLGSGFTIAAQRRGRQIDATDATASGPMAPSRAGSLPALDFLRMCFSQKHPFEELKGLLVGAGGWIAHLGTDDIREIYRRIDEGDQAANLVLDATLFQIAKETGSMTATLRGEVDGIVVTGGVSRSERFVDALKERLSWINAPFIVVPGEREMEALADGAFRALRGDCPAESMARYLGS